ncbi:hypothetical protein CP533_2159 [Ophiocordyceps camponoti-saundersi (nom. inval.)]|nr:hypothetical protein CP533_2159 [Ophiocordyceps camponoti-saundersi (nom. inval.)]
MDQGNVALIPAELKYEEVDCAFCGVPIIHELLEERAPEIQAWALEKTQETRWLHVARLIGSNPGSNKPLNVQVSAETFDSGNGNFLLEEREIKTYYRRDGHPFVVPFHNDCLMLLVRYLQANCRRFEIAIDLEILFDALNNLSLDDNSSRKWKALAIPYEGVGQRGMIDPFTPGFEHLAMSPVSIPELGTYFRNLPRRSIARPEGIAASSGNQGGDIFSRLGEGIMKNICQYLETTDVANWRSASRSAARLDLDNDFWKTRCGRDMPWLFDFPDDPLPDTDWAEVYSDLMKASQPNRRETALGLVNRRRIWENHGPFFSRAYTFADNCKNYWMRELARYVGNFDVKMSLPLIYPPALKTAIYLPTLLCEGLEDLEYAEPSINLSWTISGTLAGIDVVKNGRMETMDHRCTEDHPDSEDMMPFDQRVPIPLDDWITGLVMYCSTDTLHVPDADSDDDDLFNEHVEDDMRDEALAASSEELNGYYSFKRRVVGIEVQFAHRDPVLHGIRTCEAKMVHTSNGRFVVGFRVERQTSSAAVSRVGLVMAPITFNMPGLERVIPDDQWRDHEVHTHLFTWSQLPPVPLRLCRGLGWKVKAAETRPLEVLVLGRTHEELALLTSISMDDELECIRADYLVGPPRFIGHMRDTRRVFDIDGPGGERIVNLFLNHDQELGTWRLQLGTNFQRQFLVDQGARGATTRLPQWSPMRGLNLMGGIYATWLRGYGHDLAGVGCLTLDHRIL